MGRSGIRAAYATGRGRVVIRARHEFEEFGKDRTRIIITELPYQVNKRQLIRNIAEQVKEKRLEGISDLRDETDRNGMRVVIELKRDANPQVVLNHLFTRTSCRPVLPSICWLWWTIRNSRKFCPCAISLMNILRSRKKSSSAAPLRSEKGSGGAHLLEGLLVAQDNIDEVIQIIRTSYDDAKERLCERFGLDDIQAQAILMTCA